MFYFYIFYNILIIEFIQRVYYQLNYLQAILNYFIIILSLLLIKSIG
jgi:hypothetical protein